MRSILLYLLLFSTSICCLTSCGEELKMVEFIEQAPVIESFAPATGAPGTVVTLKGSYLNRVDEVLIGETKAVIVSKTSDKEMQVAVPALGTTGKVVAKNSVGKGTSAEDFTYIYPTPVISKYPESGDVASVIVFIGQDLSSVGSVAFNGIQGEIMNAASAELAVKVPNVAVGAANIVFTYKNDKGIQTIDGSQPIQVTKTSPTLNLVSIPAAVKPGDRITLTGENLEKIDSVMLGNSKVSIGRITPDGRSIDLVFTDDKYNYLGGDNVLPLRAYGLYNTEFPLLSSFKITVPKVLSYKDVRMEAGQDAGNTGKFFFNFEDGDAYNGLYWRTMDKVAYSRMKVGVNTTNVGSCSNVNVLNKFPAERGITKDEYNLVPPYVYLISISSTFPIVCPAGVNSLYRSINSGTGVNNSSAEKTVPASPATGMLGTPLVFYRTLNPNALIEKVLIDKVHDGSIADEVITSEMVKNLDFSASVGPVDNYSNALNFNHAALPHGGRTSGPRPSMGTLALADMKPTADLQPITSPTVVTEGSNVIVVIYYSYDYDKAKPNENIRKVGFIELTGICTGGPVTQGVSGATGKNAKNGYITFNCYWQRTPEGGW